MLFTSNSSLLNPYDMIKPTAFSNFNEESINEFETISVMVSNTPVFGKQFRVAPGVSVKDSSPESPLCDYHCEKSYPRMPAERCI